MEMTFLFKGTRFKKSNQGNEYPVVDLIDEKSMNFATEYLPPEVSVEGLKFKDRVKGTFELVVSFGKVQARLLSLVKM